MQPAPQWKVILAFVLDLILAFVVFGYVVAAVSGNLDGGSFQLEGGLALLVFALVIAYLVLGHRVLGGTVFQRVLRIAPGTTSS